VRATHRLCNQGMTRLLLDLAAISVTFAVGSITWASNAPTRCSDFMDRTAQLNATQLFDAAAPCVAEKRPFEATLLMIEGQIRAMADMELLAPKTDQDKMLAASLYGKIFYFVGGAGDRKLYRDPAKTTELFRRIEIWIPAFPADYDPGWQYKRRPTRRHTTIRSSMRNLIALRSCAVTQHSSEMINTMLLRRNWRRSKGEIRRESLQGQAMGRVLKNCRN
jgi:hypothetical protein